MASRRLAISSLLCDDDEPHATPPNVPTSPHAPEYANSSAAAVPMRLQGVSWRHTPDPVDADPPTHVPLQAQPGSSHVRRPRTASLDDLLHHDPPPVPDPLQGPPRHPFLYTFPPPLPPPAEPLQVRPPAHARLAHPPRPQYALPRSPSDPARSPSFPSSSHSYPARSPSQLLSSPSHLLPSPSHLLPSPSHLLPSPSQLLASPSHLLPSLSRLHPHARSPRSPQTQMSSPHAADPVVLPSPSSPGMAGLEALVLAATEERRRLSGEFPHTAVDDRTDHPASAQRPRHPSPSFTLRAVDTSASTRALAAPAFARDVLHAHDVLAPPPPPAEPAHAHDAGGEPPAKRRRSSPSPRHSLALLLSPDPASETAASRHLLSPDVTVSQHAPVETRHTHRTVAEMHYTAAEGHYATAEGHYAAAEGHYAAAESHYPVSETHAANTPTRYTNTDARHAAGPHYSTADLHPQTQRLAPEARLHPSSATIDTQRPPHPSSHRSPESSKHTHKLPTPTMPADDVAHAPRSPVSALVAVPVAVSPRKPPSGSHARPKRPPTSMDAAVAEDVGVGASASGSGGGSGLESTTRGKSGRTAPVRESVRAASVDTRDADARTTGEHSRTGEEVRDKMKAGDRDWETERENEREREKERKRRERTHKPSVPGSATHTGHTHRDHERERGAADADAPAEVQHEQDPHEWLLEHYTAPSPRPHTHHHSHPHPHAHAQPSSPAEKDIDLDLEELVAPDLTPHAHHADLMDLDVDNELLSLVDDTVPAPRAPVPPKPARESMPPPAMGAAHMRGRSLEGAGQKEQSESAGAGSSKKKGTAQKTVHKAKPPPKPRTKAAASTKPRARSAKDKDAGALSASKSAPTLTAHPSGSRSKKTTPLPVAGPSGVKRSASAADASRSRSASVMRGTAGPEVKADVQEDEDGAVKVDDKLYCICKTGYDEDRVMIACDRCDEWYHTQCVDMPDLEVDLVDQFICPVCVEQNPQLHLKTTYKQRCLRGQKHPEPASRAACHKPARGALSKYCSDACGVLYMEERLRAWGGDPRQLWEGVKDAERREAVVVVVKNDAAAPAAAAADAAGGDGAAPRPVLDIVKPARTKVERETERLRAVLAKITQTRAEIKVRLEVVLWRERLLELATARAEGSHECGWDQRLLFGDEEFAEFGAGVLESYEELEKEKEGEGAAPADGAPAEDGEWWCTGKKKCERHVGWQKLRSAEVTFEKESIDDALAKLTAHEREIRKQIEDVLVLKAQPASPLRMLNGNAMPDEPPYTNGSAVKEGKRKKSEGQ